MICGPFTAHEEHITTDATPVNKVLFELSEHASSGGNLFVMCRRPSDGATKFWSLTSVQRRDNNAPVNLSSRDVTGLGAAAELTALLQAAIAFFTDGVNVGVTITGIAAQTLEWCLDYRGIQVTD